MIETVTLYRAPNTVVDAAVVAEWLNERIDASVLVEDRFLDLYADDSLAREFASARVISPHSPETGNTMTGIVRYEQSVLENPEQSGGVLYDGLQVQDAFRARLDTTDSGLSHLHVPLLDRVVGTWGDHDGRWHKRVNVLGALSIVSIPGLYEAPAKPEEYYKAKQGQAMFSGSAPPREVLENQIDGEFLVYDDPRTTDAIKGYVLQAYHYLETGNPFCTDDRCRLYNAHRQPGVVRAQLQSPAFCESHTACYK